MGIWEKEMWNELQAGLRTGELWYVKLAFSCFMLAYAFYLWATCISESPKEKQQKEAVFAGRLVLASIAAVAISLIRALFKTVFGTLAQVIVGIIAILLIKNIEKLPIWEEGEEE